MAMDTFATPTKMDHNNYEDLRRHNIEDNKRALANLMADIQSKLPPVTPPKQKKRKLNKGSIKSPDIIRRNPVRRTRLNPDRFEIPRVRSRSGSVSSTISSCSSLSSAASSNSERLVVRFGFFKRPADDTSPVKTDKESGSEEEEEEYPLPQINRTSRKQRTVKLAEDVSQEDMDMVASFVSDKKYDSIYGTTCHQCRQKTDDTKTICRSKECFGVRGQFCGPCLRNRYGECAKAALKDPLKSWLEKLFPHTSAVTEGRIKHRIHTLLNVCASLSIVRCLQLLEEEYDFHALAEPLRVLGLTRLHLTGVCEFNGPPLNNISNHVVVCLENFRSQINEPTTFVNRWLNILYSPCNGLTRKQLKLRVAKVIKQSKTLNKKRDLAGLDEFLKNNFLEDDQIPPPKKSSYECDSFKNSIKKDSLIKKLENENEESEKEIDRLKFRSEILEQDLKQTKHEKEKLVDIVKEQKVIQKENLKLKSVNKKFESEIKDFKEKRTYKQNTILTKTNTMLQTKVDQLEIKVSKIKSQANFETVSELKRKVENEQAQKSKWKTKFRKLEDSLVIDNEASNSNNSDDNDNNSDQEPLLKLRENRHNKFNSDVRLTYMALQGEADIPAAKCSKVVDIVSKHLHGQELIGLPCVSSVLNMADEGHHVAKQQIADQLLSSTHFTLSSDGTSRQKRQYMERHVTLDNGTVLSLGFTEIASENAKSMLEQAIEILEEITEVHCSSWNLIQERDETFVEILKKLKTLMSDRAANMKAFDKLFHEFKKEKLGPDDASTIFLFCNAHVLLGFSAGTETVLKDIEEEISEPGTSFGGPPLFFKEQASLGLIRCAADVLGPRGDDKNGANEEWLAYCKKENIKSMFCSYRNNRFNNLFQNACALIFHKDHILDFLGNYCSNSNQKLKSIQEALKNDKILATILGVSIFNCVLTRPYWDLMNSKKPYSEFPQYVRLMNAALQEWSSISEPESIVKLNSIFQDFQNSNSLDFDVHLMSGNYCKETFVKTFKLLVSEIHAVIKRQLAEFLDGGIFGGDLPEDVKKILDKCPLTNLRGERLFGDFDYDISKRRHSSTHHRTTINMWKHNQTAAWLQEKSEKDKERILLSAHKCGKNLRTEHREAVKREKDKILKRIEENERKKNQKELLNLQQKKIILDAILKKGFCTTNNDLHEIFTNGSLEDLKNQIRYRKIFLNEKNLKLTGTKQQLYETLRNCMS